MVSAALVVVATLWLGANAEGSESLASVPSISDGVAWTLVWEDDFDGSELNSSNWRAANNYTHCAPCETELYLADRVAVANSTLILTTQRDHVVGPDGAYHNFSSGWVDTSGKVAYQYGLFEVRAKLPVRGATAIWPAHWLMPESSICWPTGGEVDIMEYMANPLENKVFGSYRWGTSCGNDKRPLPGAGYPPLGAPDIDWSADFHVFAVSWNSTALTFYVDGNAYETKTAEQVILPQTPMYFILNSAIAWYWFSPGQDASYPAYHYVDWVRIWQ